MISSGVPWLGVAAVLATAAAFDLRERRVPNWLTYGLAALALAGHVHAGTLGTGLAGAAACGAIGIAMYAVSGLGAGDAKLLIALGAAIGPGLGLDVALITLCGGAAVGVVLLIVRGHVLAMARELWLCVLTLSTPGARKWLPDDGQSFPLAPVIAAAFVLVSAVPALRPVSPLLGALA